jgi:cell division cycle protein 37
MDFLSKHLEIVSQKYSDEILAEAFRLEMDNKGKEARQCVHQSLILQYCGLLGTSGIGMFFKRCVLSPNNNSGYIHSILG